MTARHTIAALLLTIFVAAAMANEPAEKMATLLKESASLREACEIDLEHQIGYIKDDIKRTKAERTNKSTAKAKKERLEKYASQLKEAEALLKSLKSGKVHPVRPLSDKMRVGAIGFVHALRVEQIIDAKSFRGSLNDVPVWVTGLATEKLVDDTLLTTGGELFEITGTQKYETVLGAGKTVFEIRPLSKDSLVSHPDGEPEFVPIRKFSTRLP